MPRYRINKFSRSSSRVPGIIPYPRRSQAHHFYRLDYNVLIIRVVNVGARAADPLRPTLLARGRGATRSGCPVSLSVCRGFCIIKPAACSRSITRSITAIVTYTRERDRTRTEKRNLPHFHAARRPVKYRARRYRGERLHGESPVSGPPVPTVGPGIGSPVQLGALTYLSDANCGPSSSSKRARRRRRSDSQD